MSDAAPQAAAALAPQKLDAWFDGVLSQTPDDPGPAYQYFEGALQHVGVFGGDPEYPVVKGLLEALSLQNQGIYALGTTDFSTAAALLEEAGGKFRQAGDNNWADVTQGLQMEAQANVEIRQQNVEGARKLMAGAEKLLAKDPKMAMKYAPLIEDCTFASAQIGAAQAAQSYKFSEAEVLCEDASNRAEAIAKKYLGEGTPPHFLYLGLAKYWRAYFQFFKVQADLQIFSLKNILEQADPAKTAREARTLLAQASSLPISVDSYRLSGVFVGILEAVPGIAKLANALLEGLPSPPIDYVTLQAHLNEAKNAAASGGNATFQMFRLCERTSEILDNLRRIDSDRIKPVARPSDPNTPIHLFVIMPFAEYNKSVEDALRAILEDEPYYFKLTLARDSILMPNLLDNVKAHMYSADAFVADITGLNPNVMMELGMVEGDPAKRPVFVLKRKAKAADNEPPVPSDLKGKLYLEYDLVATASEEEEVNLLVKSLRPQFKSVAELAALSKRPHTRFTSAQYINRKLLPKKIHLEVDDISTLQSNFPSLEELEAASAAQVAMKTGLDAQIAAILLSALVPAAGV